MKITLGSKQAEAALAALGRGIDEIEAELGDEERNTYSKADIELATQVYRKLYQALRESKGEVA